MLEIDTQESTETEKYSRTPDENGNVVLRLTDNETEKIQIVATLQARVTSKAYTLDELILNPQI